MTKNKIIVALDSNNLTKTLKLVSIIKREVFAFKIGYEFFFNFGIDGYHKVKKICPNIFLDLKLHDIPNTVNKGMLAINKLKPLLTTIHISGGDQMMKLSKVENTNMKVLGVTLLTSLNNNQTKKYYNENSIQKIVKNFVKQAKKNNLDGVVCSPKEIKLIRKIVDEKFIIVTPGIRLDGGVILKDDQKRTLNPKKAIELGANYLVVGRPITESATPLNTIKRINSSLK
tara:strand:+ start:9181 stop:9867 length:687 start_codon:yes stop_codon:yes gene_type:complete